MDRGVICPCDKQQSATRRRLGDDGRIDAGPLLARHRVREHVVRQHHRGLPVSRLPLPLGAARVAAPVPALRRAPLLLLGDVPELPDGAAGPQDPDDGRAHRPARLGRPRDEPSHPGRLELPLGRHVSGLPAPHRRAQAQVRPQGSGEARARPRLDDADQQLSLHQATLGRGPAATGPLARLSPRPKTGRAAAHLPRGHRLHPQQQSALGPVRRPARPARVPTAAAPKDDGLHLRGDASAAGRTPGRRLRSHHRLSRSRSSVRGGSAARQNARRGALSRASNSQAGRAQRRGESQEVARGPMADQGAPARALSQEQELRRQLRLAEVATAALDPYLPLLDLLVDSHDDLARYLAPVPALDDRQFRSCTGSSKRE
uniref:Uncharacterized protein n=1 Tax=Trichogramma kaykai TaxID=54128 RepID=A0ABD2WXC2_9HYME